MILSLKEYLAIAVIILFLVVLSGTRIRIGSEKFHQLICAGHLKKMYRALIAQLEENPDLFNDASDKPWYELLGIDEHYLVCPAAESHTATPENRIHTDYAMNKSIIDFISAQHGIDALPQRKVLILDSVWDESGINLFPLTNPAFRHSGGCNILLSDGSVVWFDKDAFRSDNVGFTAPASN